MKTVLLKIDYCDNSCKFYFDSYIKNRMVTFDPAIKSIHDVVRDVCEEEGMILTYKGKPQGNIFRDKKDGSSHVIGYLYRGKSEIHDRDMAKAQTGFFDVWAEIHEVTNFEFEEID